MLGIGTKAVGTVARLMIALCVGAAMSGAAAWAQGDGQLTPEERRQRLEVQIQEAKDRAAAQQRATDDAATSQADDRKRAAARAAAERRKASDEATAALREAQMEATRKAEEEAAAALAASRAPFGVFRDCPTCPEMVRIPAGSFSMGDLAAGSAGEKLPGRVFQALRGALGGESKNEERPVRTVQVAGFAVGKYELTFAQWDACVDAGGCSNYRPADHGWGRDQLPVINVSWSQVQQYVLWLSNTTGQRYRLLSEAEWEYVARAGTKSEYSFGAAINCAQAHFGHADGTCGTNQKTLPVGSFAANPWGLHDLHGNVWEWVQDCRNTNYADAPTTGTARTTGDCDRRMYRGGGWSSSPAWLRSAFRGDDASSARYYDLGVRLARSD